MITNLPSDEDIVLQKHLFVSVLPVETKYRWVHGLKKCYGGALNMKENSNK